MDEDTLRIVLLADFQGRCGTMDAAGDIAQTKLDHEYKRAFFMGQDVGQDSLRERDSRFS